MKRKKTTEKKLISGKEFQIAYDALINEVLGKIGKTLCHFNTDMKRFHIFDGDKTYKPCKITLEDVYREIGYTLEI